MFLNLKNTFPFSIERNPKSDKTNGSVSTLKSSNTFFDKANYNFKGKFTSLTASKNRDPEY